MNSPVDISLRKGKMSRKYLNMEFPIVFLVKTLEFVSCAQRIPHVSDFSLLFKRIHVVILRTKLKFS